MRLLVEKDTQKTITEKIFDLLEENNALEDAAKEAKKHQKGLGAFVKLDAGNVEKGNEMFNQATTINTASGECSGMSEDLRAWGDQEIQDNKAYSAIADEISKFLKDNDIQYKEIYYDPFDYNYELIIRDISGDPETVGELIESEFGFSYFSYAQNLKLDVSQEYEDEYGDIQYRVNTNYIMDNEEDIDEALETDNTDDLQDKIERDKELTRVQKIERDKNLTRVQKIEKILGIKL